MEGAAPKSQATPSELISGSVTVPNTYLIMVDEKIEYDVLRGLIADYFDFRSTGKLSVHIGNVMYLE